MEETQEELQAKEALRVSKLIAQLQYNEHFKAWKDEIIEPYIRALEDEIGGPKADALSESVLRGKLNNITTVKYLFKDIFDQSNTVILKDKRDNPK